MAKKHVLVVEDEEDIAELLRYNLAKDSCDVTHAATGENALKKARAAAPPFDIILLDLMLPGVGGLDVCRILKGDPQTASIPIIMLTAKGEETDIVAGLDMGADDYVTKPFSPRVLLARVKAVLRRRAEKPAGEEETVAMHGFVIHPGRHEVLVKGKPAGLTLTEFRILHLLARRPGWVFTRGQIVDGVRGSDYPVTERSVDVHVTGLRKKLGAAGECVETVRGVGYRLREE
jgi:two-component system, OmpR family, alkaline phosphatase synthesis response regulator PhoP